jgi:hypothetical protein
LGGNPLDPLRHSPRAPDRGAPRSSAADALRLAAERRHEPPEPAERLLHDRLLANPGAHRVEQR